MPNATTTIYARVTDPVRLSFAPDGTLFVGRDNSGSGGENDDAVKIHRIGPGGAPVEEYGNTTISDPDAVFYDATGQFSGTPGAVLVAGTQATSLLGKISKIMPDGAINDCLRSHRLQLQPEPDRIGRAGRAAARSATMWAARYGP